MKPVLRIIKIISIALPIYFIHQQDRQHNIENQRNVENRQFNPQIWQISSRNVLGNVEHSQKLPNESTHTHTEYDEIRLVNKNDSVSFLNHSNDAGVGG